MLVLGSEAKHAAASQIGVFAQAVTEQTSKGTTEHKDWTILIICEQLL